jgi:hypothetical protein
MSFLAELKRRKVFRFAAVYGAAAFAIVQAADPGLDPGLAPRGVPAGIDA